MDNASVNGAMMKEISNKLSVLGYDFDPDEKTISCFAHVMNLCSQNVIDVVDSQKRGRLGRAKKTASKSKAKAATLAAFSSARSNPRSLYFGTVLDPSKNDGFPEPSTSRARREEDDDGGDNSSSADDNSVEVLDDDEGDVSDDPADELNPRSDDNSDDSNGHNSGGGGGESDGDSDADSGNHGTGKTRTRARVKATTKEKPKKTAKEKGSSEARPDPKRKGNETEKGKGQATATSTAKGKGKARSKAKAKARDDWTDSDDDLIGDALDEEDDLARSQYDPPPLDDPNSQTYDKACARAPLKILRALTIAIRASGSRRELFRNTIILGNAHRQFMVGDTVLTLENLELMRDVRTRWGSTRDMLRRARELRPVRAPPEFITFFAELLFRR